jgi:hypothetical protein
VQSAHGGILIYRNTDLVRNTHWSLETNPEAGSIARQFLVGEYELLKLAHVRSSTVVDLRIFIEASKDLAIEVQRAANGDLLITARDAEEVLMLTGRTASVLRGYLDEEPVRMQDRFDMTQRLPAV